MASEGQEHLLQTRLLVRVVLHLQFALRPLHVGEDVGQQHVGVGHLHVGVAFERIKQRSAGEALLDEGHEGLDGSPPAVFIARHLGDQHEALAELGLEVLGAAQTPEGTVDLNGDARAQSFTLLHAERAARQRVNSTTVHNHPSLKDNAIESYVARWFTITHAERQRDRELNSTMVHNHPC